MSSTNGSHNGSTDPHAHSNGSNGSKEVIQIHNEISPGEGSTKEAVDSRLNVDFADYISLIWHNRFLVIAITAFVFTATYLLVRTLPDQYESYSTVIVENKRPDNQSMLLPALESSTLLYQDPVELDVQMIRNSSELAELVALDLFESPHTPDGDTLPILLRYGFGTLDQATVLEELTINLPREIIVEKSEQTDPRGFTYMNMFTIGARSTSDYEVSFLVNAYLDNLLEFDQKSVRENLARTVEFLETLIDTRYTVLREKTAEINEFKQNDWELVTDQSGAMAIENLRDYDYNLKRLELGIQLSSELIERLEAEKDYAVGILAEGANSGLVRWLDQIETSILDLEVRAEVYLMEDPDLAENPSLNAEYKVIRNRLDYLYRKRDEYQEQFTEFITDEKGLEPEGITQYILDLRREIEREQVQLDNYKLEKEFLEEELSDIQTTYFGLLDRVLDLEMLTKELRFSENLYETLLMSLQETQIAMQTLSTRFRVLNPARIPKEPFGPNRIRFYLLGLVAGLGAGVGLVLVRFLTDDKIREPEQIRKTGLPLIGVTPAMETYFDLYFKDQPTVKIQDLTVSRDMVSIIDPLAAGSEAYRRIRSAIEFARPDQKIRVVSFTSSKPGEGKTITAMNTALTFAQYGQKTLLIDSDLRKPQVHKRLGLTREPGLTEILFDKAEMSEAVRETSIENLSVLTCGFKISNTAEIVGSKKMADLIKSLRDSFDIIVIDTPPIQVVTDALPMAVASDGVVVLSRADVTEFNILEDTVSELRRLGAEVIGVVLNNFDVENSRAYYNYRYKYQYEYKYKYSYSYKDYRVDYDAAEQESAKETV